MLKIFETVVRFIFFFFCKENIFAFFSGQITVRSARGEMQGETIGKTIETG